MHVRCTNIECALLMLVAQPTVHALQILARSDDGTKCAKCTQVRRSQLHVIQHLVRLRPSSAFVGALLRTYIAESPRLAYSASEVIHDDVHISSPSGRHNRHGAGYVGMDPFPPDVMWVLISPLHTQRMHQDQESSQVSH